MRKNMLGLIIAALFLLSNAAVADPLNEYIPEYETEFDDNTYNVQDDPSLFDYTNGIKLRGEPGDPNDPGYVPLPVGLFVMVGFVGVYMLRIRMQGKKK